MRYSWYKYQNIFVTLIMLCCIATFAFAGGGAEAESEAEAEMEASDASSTQPKETKTEQRVLVFNSNASDPAPKEVMEKTVAMFEAENPDIDVQLNTFDHEAYKTNIRNFLVSEAPDVALWFAGNRMKFFVDQGLLEDVSDVWTANDLENKMSSSFSALTVNGKQYGVPYAYYQWGVYYRTDIFERYGLSAPNTWEEFLAVCQTLKDNGITPITVGTKYLWTAAGWFDYMNIRTNGLDYHLKLTDGDASYLDSELDATFANWRQLIDMGAFLEDHASYSWQEGQAPMINGDAAMYLIGNFIVPFFEDAGMVDDVGFFQFPIIDPSVGVYEDAPTDTIHIPAKAKNKADARKFIAFVARADINNMMATGIGNLPPNNEAPAPSDRFLQAGFDMLGKADGLAQFYDRDTDPEMASIGMEGFQEFMVQPDRLPDIRKRLDAARKRIFGK